MAAHEFFSVLEYEGEILWNEAAREFWYVIKGPLIQTTPREL